MKRVGLKINELKLMTSILNIDKMYNAEFKTDKYIRETFFPDFEYNGTMVEVGAGPTVFYSMSKHFRDYGWRCICIDPNPKFVDEHKKNGNEIYQLAISNYEGKSEFNVVTTGMWDENYDGISYSGLEIKYEMPNYKIDKIMVEVRTLNSLLDELNVNNVDFISVDVEGLEIEVIEGSNINKFNPKVILLENYTHDPKYELFMETLGYILNIKIEYNYIFEKK